MECHRPGQHRRLPDARLLHRHPDRSRSGGHRRPLPVRPALGQAGAPGQHPLRGRPAARQVPGPWQGEVRTPYERPSISQAGVHRGLQVRCCGDRVAAKHDHRAGILGAGSGAVGGHAPGAPELRARPALSAVGRPQLPRARADRGCPADRLRHQLRRLGRSRPGARKWCVASHCGHGRVFARRLLGRRRRVEMARVARR